jgi:hypothetical protein
MSFACIRYPLLVINQKFEDIKGVTSNRKLKDRQYNDKMRKDKITNFVFIISFYSFLQHTSNDPLNMTITAIRFNTAATIITALCTYKNISNKWQNNNYITMSEQFQNPMGKSRKLAGEKKIYTPYT